MKWTLFARLEQAVARARGLQARRDTQRFGDELRGRVPELFASLEGGAESKQARRAADLVARKALELLAGLPAQINESAASLVDATPSAPAEALAKTAALAYVACVDDILADDLPVGYGLVDDAILLRAAELGPPTAWPEAGQADELGTQARFLSLLLPRDTLERFDGALDDLFRMHGTYTRIPLFVLKQAARQLIEDPPEDVSELLPPAAEDEVEDGPAPRPPLFALSTAELCDDDGDALRFRFADGVELTLTAEGELETRS